MTTIANTSTLTVRAAREADAWWLHRLAALDSQRPLEGDVLLAEDAGRPVAALALDGGRSVADPFAPTQAALALLQVRAAQLTAAPKPVRLSLRRFRLRAASG